MSERTVQSVELPRLAYRTDEVSRMIGRSEHVVRDMCQRGRVPGAFRQGKFWVIPVSGLRELLGEPGAAS